MLNSSIFNLNNILMPAGVLLIVIQITRLMPAVVWLIMVKSEIKYLRRLIYSCSWILAQIPDSILMSSRVSFCQCIFFYLLVEAKYLFILGLLCIWLERLVSFSVVLFIIVLKCMLSQLLCWWWRNPLWKLRRGTAEILISVPITLWGLCGGGGGGYFLLRIYHWIQMST